LATAELQSRDDLRLVARLCEASSGAVRVWGRDVTTVPAASLRASLAFVPQEPWLADDTLLWNLRMGNLEASDAQVAEACAAASLSGTIAALPDGYNTRVGERGGRLSGGEKQRTVVARALLRDAPLMLADEPTASADALTEVAIVRALRRGTAPAKAASTSGAGAAGASGGGAAAAASGGGAADGAAAGAAAGATTGAAAERTLLVVVHRLAALCPTADHIVVFRDGRVVEQGRHAELLAMSGGEYAMLWRAQEASAGESKP